ncbi:glycosyl transferase, partial [Amycolatopsis lurida]
RDFDEPELARRAMRQGAAIALHGEHGAGPAIRRHIERILTVPGAADGARRLREDIRAMPTPNDLVPRLEELTAKYRTR